jgi:hypothetical protein
VEGGPQIGTSAAAFVMPATCGSLSEDKANMLRWRRYGAAAAGAAAFAVGRLTQIVDPTGSETYSYDQMLKTGCNDYAMARFPSREYIYFGSRLATRDRARRVLLGRSAPRFS